MTLDVAHGARGRAGPQVVRGPQAENADLALESVALLSATKVQTVLPGHGEPWLDGIASDVEIARRPDRLAAQPPAKDRR